MVNRTRCPNGDTGVIRASESSGIPISLQCCLSLKVPWFFKRLARPRDGTYPWSVETIVSVPPVTMMRTSEYSLFDTCYVVISSICCWRTSATHYSSCFASSNSSSTSSSCYASASSLLIVRRLPSQLIPARLLPLLILPRFEDPRGIKLVSSARIGTSESLT